MMVRIKTIGLLIALLLFGFLTCSVAFPFTSIVSATIDTDTNSHSSLTFQGGSTTLKAQSTSVTTTPTAQPTNVSATPTATSSPNQSNGDQSNNPTDAQLVQPVNSTLTIKATHNLFPLLDGWLTSWMIPDSTGSGMPTIFLNNQSATAFTVNDPSIVLVGASTGTTVDTQITLPSCPTSSHPCTITLPPHHVTHIPLSVNANGLPPDHYQGTIQFFLQGTSTTVPVNIDLSVRFAPFWPIIVILIGILVGRLALNMTTPLAQKQIDLLPRYYALRKEILALPPHFTADNHEIASKLNCVKQTLEKSLQSIYDDIESSDSAKTEDVVTQEVKNLETSVSLFQTLIKLKEKVEQQNSQDSLTSLKKALDDLNQGDTATTQKDIDDIKTKVSETQHLMKLYGVGLYGHARQTALREGVLSEQQKSVRRQRVASGYSVFARKSAAFLAWITGHPLPDAELRYWCARPLLAVVLIILLIFLGLQTLYVNATPTFGVAGLYDFLTLFLWGLSSDIAQRSLQNLPIGVGLPSGSGVPSPAPSTTSVDTQHGQGGQITQPPPTTPPPSTTPPPP